MKYTEYATMSSSSTYKTLDPRTQKRMTLEVQVAGIEVSIKDVRNFLESDCIYDYNPISEFLVKCDGSWDGHDYIADLAQTVPNNNPHWTSWFRTWFLAMVNSWLPNKKHTYGNSVVPLLISGQGYKRVPSAADCFRTNWNGATATTSHCRTSARCIRPCRNSCL